MLLQYVYGIQVSTILFCVICVSMCRPVVISIGIRSKHFSTDIIFCFIGYLFILIENIYTVENL